MQHTVMIFSTNIVLLEICPVQCPHEKAGMRSQISTPSCTHDACPRIKSTSNNNSIFLFLHGGSLTLLTVLSEAPKTLT